MALVDAANLLYDAIILSPRRSLPVKGNLKEHIPPLVRQVDLVCLLAWLTACLSACLTACLSVSKIPPSGPFWIPPHIHTQGRSYHLAELWKNLRAPHQVIRALRIPRIQTSPLFITHQNAHNTVLQYQDRMLTKVWNKHIPPPSFDPVSPHTHTFLEPFLCSSIQNTRH